MDGPTRLALPTARTIPWPALVVAVALAWAIVRLGIRDGLDPRVVALPVATTLLGAWLCLLFEDRAFELTRPSPTPLWLRRGVRVAIALPPVAAAWLAVTWIGPLTGPTAPMAEMAIVTARKIRLEQRANAGDSGARAALNLAYQPSQFLAR